MAILFCLCSEADAFVAASFTSLPPSAKLAFLVLGPMLDLKLYLMYTRVFRRELIFTIFGSVIVLSFIYSVAIQLFWRNCRRPPSDGKAQAMAHDHEHPKNATYFLDQLCTVATCGRWA